VKKNYFWLFAVLLIIIFILFVLRIFTTSAPNPTTIPTPTLIPGQPASENYNINPQTKQQLNKAYFVSNLVNHVPYQGKFFTLDYNFGNATFLLTLDKNNLNEANAEFNAYLKTNNIAASSWFDNLVTSYK
jgi:hypothetical protein